MKIVVLDGYTENPGDLSWDGFRQFGEVIVYDRTPKELILSRMDGAEVVFTNKVVITRKIIEASPELRFIGTLSTGYNTVDLEAADERQIPVSNIPSYSTQAVATAYNGIAVRDMSSCRGTFSSGYGWKMEQLS